MLLLLKNHDDLLVTAQEGDWKFKDAARNPYKRQLPWSYTSRFRR